MGHRPSAHPHAAAGPALVQPSTQGPPISPHAFCGYEFRTPADAAAQGLPGEATSADPGLLAVRVRGRSH